MVDGNIDYFAIIRFEWDFFLFGSFVADLNVSNVWSTQHSANDWKTWDNRPGVVFFSSPSLAYLVATSYVVAYILWRHRYCHLTTQEERERKKTQKINIVFACEIGATELIDSGWEKCKKENRHTTKIAAIVSFFMRR